MSFYTRSGDDGYTGLLGDERVPKYHIRPQVYGTLDEASAALGLSRAICTSEEMQDVLRQVQRDLYHMMAEIAATPQAAHRFTVISETHVKRLESEIESFGERVETLKDFMLGGDTTASAALNLARTIVRRAERLVVKLFHEDKMDNPYLLPYLNRLSSLCFVLMLWEIKQAGIDQPTLAKTGDE
jgi:cob(I)alamin adenosyltransferase